MQNNKKLEDLPEDETTKPWECISMDIFETDMKEHALAMVDRHTGYVWCKICPSMLKWEPQTVGLGASKKIQCKTKLLAKVTQC